MGMSEAARAAFFTTIVSDEPCGDVTRTFYQGMHRASRAVFWNVACSNGRSYSLSIEANATGSSKIMDCGQLKVIGGTDCFVPLK